MRKPVITKTVFAQTFGDVPVSCLNLSVKAANFLENGRIYTMNDLYARIDQIDGFQNSTPMRQERNREIHKAFEDWAEQCPSACDSLRPDDSMVSVVKRLSTIIPFSTAQKNSCFSMQDCIDGIIALAWEDISDYDEYPEPFRIVFQFGERIDSVTEKLFQRNESFNDDNATDEENEEETPDSEPEEDTPF